MFTAEDLLQIAEKGIALSQIEEQMNRFHTGFSKSVLDRPATVNDGIEQWNEQTVCQHEQTFTTEIGDKTVMKFVPASGAATRMFKSLFDFSAKYIGQYQTLHKDFPEVHQLLNHLHKFSFYEDLEAAMQSNNLNLQEYLSRKEYNTIVNYILHPHGLAYGSLPKALLKFHRYGENTRFAFEEHLVEGALYGNSRQNSVIHFTVSPEHRPLFQQRIAALQKHYEDQYGVRFHISYSEQKSHTDTIAVDQNNDLLRDDDGRLIFRPAGHGALLENLNDCPADIVFVKNIDNVQLDSAKQTVTRYKKALAGYLITLQKQLFRFLQHIDQKAFLQNSDLVPVEQFLTTSLHLALPDHYAEMDFHSRLSFLREKMNRPIRICGMVKNQGEPGGGPFWTKNASGERSLQIIETAQVNRENKDQQDILNSATHFNPVDLVCGLNDYMGNRFDLKQFSDPSGGFISTKSHKTNLLKAQELPGLWNAAMAYWNTIFVEVPSETFSPVKTINDLLRPEHQNG